VQQQKRIDKSRKLWMAAALMWFGLSVTGLLLWVMWR
jgi:hypothetical protein